MLEYQPPITIGVPTKDRPLALRRLLASLTAQTYKNWDLIIVNDSSSPDWIDRMGQQWLNAIARSGHEVVIHEGPRINQAYCHNHVLWCDESHELIFRCDDDMVLFPDYLERLVQAWTVMAEQDQGLAVAAMSGTIFTEHIYKRSEMPIIPRPTERDLSIAIDGMVIPQAYMREYSDETPISAQHLYSSCLYLRDVMRRVGGWPINYSKGVSYHEETDGTYRMHLMGHALFLVPSAKAIHSHAVTGGTRRMPAAEHARRRQNDWDLFRRKITRMRAVDYMPNIAICSDHCSGIGGGQRLTYSLLEALLELRNQHARPLLGKVHLYPMREEIVESAKFIRKNFGIDIDARHLNLIGLPEHYDVVISIGHLPPDMAKMPPRIHHIHYDLFPMYKRGVPKGVDRYVSISDFTAEAIRLRWHRNPETVYPYVEPSGLDPSEVEKNKRIIVVGRPDKAIAHLVEAFHQLKDHKVRLILVLPVMDDEQLRTTKNELNLSNRCELHVGISREELSKLYEKSLILWAGRGYRGAHLPPEDAAEHFGYTAVEALSHFCLPVCYDAGGYTETTMVRWKTVEELVERTDILLSDQARWREALTSNLSIMERFSKERFKLDWLRIIQSTNVHAWTQDVEWRKSEDVSIEVVDVDKHIAILGDHPGNGTAFGLITDRLSEGLVDAGFKVHVLGINGVSSVHHQDYASLWPSRDVSIDKVAMPFLRHRNFDAALIAYDPFIGSRLLNFVRGLDWHLPTVAYISQEGSPPHIEWKNILRKADIRVTYCQSAKASIKHYYGGDVDWVYLGTDHADFQRFDDEDRHALRSILDYDEKFVIFCICRNARNKRVPGMLKVRSKLKYEYEYDDILLLLQTNRMPNQIFHGIDLAMYADQMQLNEEGKDLDVDICPMPSGRTLPFEVDLVSLLRGAQPRRFREKRQWFENLGIIGRYNIADLYLDISSAEGFCLLPDIMVDTFGGPIPIKNVRDGELVFSHLGNFQVVTGTTRRIVSDQDLVSIKRFGCSELFTGTPEHPHLVIKRNEKRLKKIRLEVENGLLVPQWIPLGEVEKGDLVVVPKPHFLPAPPDHLLISDFVLDVLHEDGEVWLDGSYRKTDGPSLSSIADTAGCSFQHVSDVLNGKRSHSTELGHKIIEVANGVNYQHPKPIKCPDLIEINDEIMEFFGLYLAEGYIGIDCRYIEFTSHKHEEYARMVEKTVAKSIFHAPCSESISNNTGKVWISSTIPGRLLDSLFGSGACKKYIPEFLFSSPHIGALLRGLFYGDGTICDGDYSFCTSSPKLAQGIFHILAANGIFALIIVDKRQSNYNYKLQITPEHNNRFYDLVRPKKYNWDCCLAAGERYRYIIETDKYFAVPIKKIERIKYSGPVYNLHVDRTKSYTSYGMATHNCLPPFEAIRCEMPVISVADHFVRSELLDGAAQLIEPSPTVDEWITGADLMMVNTDDVAAAIHAFRKGSKEPYGDPRRRKQLNEMLTWESTKEKILGYVQRCLEM